MMLMCSGMHCTECGYNCHEKCVQHVPKNCTKVRSTSRLTSLAAVASGQSSAADSGTDATLVATTSPSAVSTARGTQCIVGTVELERVSQISSSWQAISELLDVTEV